MVQEHGLCQITSLLQTYSLCWSVLQFPTQNGDLPLMLLGFRENINKAFNNAWGIFTDQLTLAII